MAYLVAFIAIFWSLSAITYMVMTWDDSQPSAPRMVAGNNSTRGEVN